MEILTEETKFGCIICKRKGCSHQQPYTTTEENLSVSQRKQSFQNGRLSKFKSCFIRIGEVKDEIIKEDLNKLYPFKNFKSVKVDNVPTILGKGTYGNVYLSKNIEDGKYYSIKQVSKHKLNQDGSDLVFENELQIHPRLNHEHIIKFFNYYETEDSYYLILEYASKGSLFDLIKSTNFKGIPEKEAFKYFIQIASAVFFLHENKFIHRDIKPENILLDDNHKAKLCDFGWCVQLSLENRNSFCGTYEYMAPEMVSETPYNFSVDIWALGVLLFELLHGYSPFKANSNREDYYLEVFQNISKSTFKIERELSENCIDLLRKLLCKNHTERIKIKDIFSHPWCTNYEKEYKEVKIRDSLSTNFHSNSSLNSNSKSTKEVNTLHRISSNSAKNNEEKKEANKKEDSSALFDKVLDKLSKKTKSKSNITTEKQREKNKTQLEFVKGKEKDTNYFNSHKTNPKDLYQTISFTSVKEKYNNDINYQEEFDKEFLKLKERTRLRCQQSIQQSMLKDSLDGYLYTNCFEKQENNMKNDDKKDRLDEIFDEEDLEVEKNDVITHSELKNSVDILDKIENNPIIFEKRDDKHEKSFWSNVVNFINPFKCG